MKKQIKLIYFGLRIEEALHAKIITEAKKQDRSASSVVRRILTKHFSRPQVDGL